MIAEGVALIIVAFLLGTIPFGWILTRAAGLGDIRSVGSGSMGATNVLRTGRKGLALLTLLLDAGKGTLAVWLAWHVDGPSWGAAAGVAAVLGHCHSIWMRGQGGKGVATGLGVLLALSWPVGLGVALVWLCTALLTRISSASSLLATVLAPVAMAVWAGPVPAIAALVIALDIIWRHRANIRRLLAGTEPRIGRGA